MSVYRRTTAQGPAQTYSYDFILRGRRFSGDTGATTKRAAEAAEKRERERAAGQTISADAPLTFEAATSRYWLEHGQYFANAADLATTIIWLQNHIGKQTRFDTIDDDLVARLVALRRGERKIRKTKAGPKDQGPVSPATVNRTVTEALRMIHRRAELNWKRPVQRIDWKRHMLAEPKERIREATPEEEAALFAAVRPDYAAALAFSILTGCRLAEIIGLRWEHVSQLHKQFQVTGKGDRSRIIPMTAHIAELLEALRGDHTDHVFTYIAEKARNRTAVDGSARIRGHRYPMTYNGLKTQWRRLRERSGVKDYRFHDNRHTAATRLLRATGNLRLAQILLGHSDIATTTKYAHAALEDLRAGMETASPTKNPTAEPQGKINILKDKRNRP